MGILTPNRPGHGPVEEPKPRSRQALEREAELCRIDVALDRSRERTAAYRDRGDAASLRVQEGVTDRLLRERMPLMRARDAAEAAFSGTCWQFHGKEPCRPGENHPAK